jgi:hypothetical protein
MSALILCLLILLVSAEEDWPPVASPVSLTVQCQDAQDLAELLFSICLTDPVCAYLYSLDERHRHQPYYRRQLFDHQLALFDIFGPPPPAPLPDTTPRWLEGRWPANVTVLYNETGDTCYNLSALGSDTERALFNYVTLDRLKTHKQYYSRLVCPQLNERLLYDAETGQFNCACLEGKKCDSESWHDTVIMILAGLTLGLFVLMALVVLVVGLRLLLMKPSATASNKDD